MFTEKKKILYGRRQTKKKECEQTRQCVENMESRIKLHPNSSFENQRFTIPKRLASTGDKAKISGREWQGTHTHNRTVHT